MQPTSAPQLPSASRPHQNQQLFSDYYLDVILPRHPEWQRFASEIAPILDRTRAIFAAYTPSSNEAQTEKDLVRPLLQILGHTFEVQAPLHTTDGTKKPDYVLYRDRAALVANKNKVLTENFLESKAFAVGEAKHWDRPLDIAVKGAHVDPLSNKNPSYQIAFYMQHSGLEWGILTNGRLWRLYHRETAHKLDRFYEVDLPALLEEGNPEKFLYFYAFFARSAFEPSPLSVSALLQASTDYARGVGDTLKVQVYEALLHLAQGFLDYPGNSLAPHPLTLEAIYDNSLIVLYRLLFVLYAEARELLPIRENPLYRDQYSVRAISHTVEQALRASAFLLPTSPTLWPRLKTLFDVIDRGSPPLKVATFNGGLFDPERHPFLEQYSVGDRHLQLAISKLTLVDGQFVDYRDLSERHLGTIYEGLLEYHLQSIEPEDGWTVALLNDKGERKATGSYYTPDYVVKYIVEQTVGPVLRDSIKDANTDRDKVAAVLAVNVLDPAMGSGHFLVEATEYIARFLVDLALTPGAGASDGSDLAYWKRRVVQACIYGVDRNPLAVDLAKLSLWLSTVARDRPLSFLDHHLRVGDALVGASIAEIQVSGAEGARQRKARKRTREAVAAGQLSLLDDDAFRQSMSTAVDSMWLIEGAAGDTVDDVKEQERVYAQLRDVLTRKYGRLAALVTATHFGLGVDPVLWQPLAEYAAGRAIVAPLALKRCMEAADQLAEQRRFFHWELEFPEVFFDRYGQHLGERAGFDAVVGNPPYVRQEGLAPLKPFFAARYQEVWYGTADLFVYFFAQGLRLLRRGGLLSYVSSNSWLRANYATALRAFLREKATVETLIDLGDNRVFADAPDVYPAIHVVRRNEPPPQHMCRAAVFNRGEGLARFHERVAAKLFPVSIHDQVDTGWHLEDDSRRRLLAKLKARGRPLDDVVAKQIFYGLKTGLNEAFIVSQCTRDRLIQEDPSAAAVVKPVLRGEDLRPWYQEDEGQYLILLPSGWTSAAFGGGLSEAEAWLRLSVKHPSIAKHLSRLAGAGRRRQDKGEYWWELRPCNYYPAFERAKIFWPDIAKFPRFSWDESGYYLTNTGYILVTDKPWLLGFLGSRCAWFLISRSAIALGERAGANRYRLIDQYMRPLPIPDPPPVTCEAMGALALALTHQARARAHLERETRRRILADLGSPGDRLNQRLSAWWEPDFTTFRLEVQKALKRDIPVKERDQWETWLTERQSEHQERSAEIVRLERELDECVYALYDLTPEEIKVVAESTTFRYGEA